MTPRQSIVLLFGFVLCGCRTTAVYDYSTEYDFDAESADTYPDPDDPMDATSSGGTAARLENLRLAAQYPWTDDGHCAVANSSEDWPTLVRNCYHALDLEHILFNNSRSECPVTQASAIMPAYQLPMIVGMCLIAMPTALTVGAVIITAAVAAYAITQAIEAVERRRVERKRKPKKKWCDCYCGMDPVPVLMNTQDFECRAQCVILGYGPTEYTCR